VERREGVINKQKYAKHFHTSYIIYWKLMYSDVEALTCKQLLEVFTT